MHLRKYYGYFRVALISNTLLTMVLIIGLPTMKPQEGLMELLARYTVGSGEISMGVISFYIYYLTSKEIHLRADLWLMLGTLLISMIWHCLLVIMVFKSI